MENKEFKDFFQDLDFDIADPAEGHQERFLEKLKKHQFQSGSSRGKLKMLWMPIMAVAASLLILFMLTGNLTGFKISNNQGDLAGISPEMKETQEFYTSLIKTELTRLNQVKSPETEVVINDALKQLEKLDLEYINLKKDLVKSGQDKRVIFAMVSNLQQRIDVLNNVLLRIEKINELKNPTNENNII
jgi:hypothetical protein